MAADERAVITIDVDVKNLNRIQQVIADLEAMGIASEVNAAKFSALTGAMNRQSGAMRGASKDSQKLWERISLLDRISGQFTKQARKLMFAVIGMSIEFGISALALASVNAAFAVGKVLAKGYQLVMQGLAAGLAAVGAAAIAAAAAFNEYQTAQFAFRYQSDAVSTSLDKSSYAMRSLYKDTQLNIYGMKALSAAFVAVSKNTRFTGESQKMLQAFSDFAASSGDPTKGLQAAANAVGLIQKKQAGIYKNSKSMSQEAINAIKEINPALAELYKTGAGPGNLGNKEKFIEMLLSGELAEKAGVAGAAQNLAGTLVSQFKSYISVAFVELNDVGQRVLNPVKEALNDIFQGFIRTFRRVSSDLVSFGQGPFLKTLTAFVGKLEDFSVMLFRKYLPQTQGFFQRMGNVFLQLKVWFLDVRNSLNEMRDGGSIVIKTFGKPIAEIFKGIGRNARSLSDIAVKNKDKFLNFGEALKNIVAALFEMSAAFRNMFTQALPFITLLLNGLSKIVGFVERLFNGFANLGPIAAALGVGVAGMTLKKGTRYARRQARYGQKSTKFGLQEVDPLEAAYRNLKYTKQGSGMNLNPAGSPLSGAMATAGSQIAGAMTTAMTPGMDAIRSSSQNAAAAINELAGAARGSGGALRGGMTGGRVDISGYAQTRPNRKPGQSDAAYRRDIAQWIRSQKGGHEAFNRQLANKSAGPLTRGEFLRQKYGSGDPVDRRPIYERGATAGTRTQAQQFAYYKTQDDLFLNGMERHRNKKAGMERAKQIAIERQQAAARAAMPAPSRTSSIFSGLRSSAKTFLMGPGSGGIVGAASVPGAGGGGSVATIAGESTLPYRTVREQGLLPYMKQRGGQALFGSGYQGRGFKAETRDWFAGRAGRENYMGSLQQQREWYMQNVDKDLKGFKPNRKEALKAGFKSQFSGLGVLGAMGAGYALQNGIPGMGGFGKATDEASGALQTGAGLLALDAKAGIAVGGLGAAKSAQTRLGGMASGAIGGAALGAKIGGAIPLPYAKLIGTGLGAIIGTGFGFVMAGRNQKKMAQDAADKVNYEQLASLAGSAIQGAMSGSLSATRSKLKQSRVFLDRYKAAGTKEERQAILKAYSTGPNAVLSGNQLSLATGKNSDDFINQMSKNVADQRAVEVSLNSFEKTMARLKQTTSMTSEEIFDLAMRKNVNLFDATKNLSDITAELGIGMVKTGKQMKDAFTDIRVAAMDVFSRFAKGKEAKDAVQAAFETVYYGNKTEDALADYLNRYSDYLNYKNPNSPLMNIATFIKDMGAGAKFGQGAKFQTGGSLYGRTPTGNALSLGQESSNLLVKQSAETVANQIGSQLLATKVQGQNPEDLRNRLIGKTTALLNAVNAGNAAGATEEQKTAATKAEQDLKAIDQLINNPASFQGLTAAEAQAKLEKYFPGLFGAPAQGETGARIRGQMSGLTTVTENSVGLNLDDENIKKISEQFAEAIKSGFLEMTDAPSWWNQAPSWWSWKFNPDTGKFEPSPDTSSPRRSRIGDTSTSKALGMTMSAHRSMDSMLTGKRSVTSAFRTNNLGSPSSDHAAGRAYDLTGQNLGQYATLAKAAGGFAEFHGAASSRHLHVVPALGRSGDTSTPMAATAAVSGGSMYQGGDISITIVESKDAKATAKEVAREIIAMQKNERRRM